MILNMIRSVKERFRGSMSTQTKSGFDVMFGIETYVIARIWPVINGVFLKIEGLV